MKPKRIQRRRVKGWRMPPGAIYVGRPTKWGNPFTPSGYYDAGYSGSLAVSKADCVDEFRRWLDGRGDPLSRNPRAEIVLADAPVELYGHDLACWCPLDQPCHAEVLLEIANS